MRKDKKKMKKNNLPTPKAFPPRHRLLMARPWAPLNFALSLQRIFFSALLMIWCAGGGGGGGGG